MNGFLYVNQDFQVKRLQKSHEQSMNLLFIDTTASPFLYSTGTDCDMLDLSLYIDRRIPHSLLMGYI